ncbi:hypothetical protein PsW64_02563 [Pseudovibrio sp. W64]|nr:hypothetical protein PsW64_02563 [Pseudovibrio sp. W64]
MTSETVAEMGKNTILVLAARLASSRLYNIDLKLRTLTDRDYIESNRMAANGHAATWQESLEIQGQMRPFACFHQELKLFAKQIHCENSLSWMYLTTMQDVKLVPVLAPPAKVFLNSRTFVLAFLDEAAIRKCCVTADDFFKTKNRTSM